MCRFNGLIALVNEVESNTYLEKMQFELFFPEGMSDAFVSKIDYCAHQQFIQLSWAIESTKISTRNI